MRHPRFTGRIFLLVSIFAAVAGAYAQPVRTGGSGLSMILNPDGSVKPGSTGSFDPNGYRLSYGPNGEPRFVDARSPSGACTPDGWDTSFGLNGTDGDVRDVVADGQGNIYIGGLFTTVQNTVARNIAKWNGTTWSALGDGTNGPIREIAISGTDVYVAGVFSTAGGVPANNVAKWDGNSWSALGLGMGGPGLINQVYAIAVSGNDVYVAGDFNSGGGFPNRIARWDGTSWSALGDGIGDHSVYAVAVSGGVVYAGGNFSTAGGAPANRIARWDGTTWSQMGSVGRVQAIAIMGTDIYVGGAIGGGNVAKWDGVAWQPLGTGTGGSASGDPVLSMTVSGSDLYVGGNFLTAGGQTVNKIAKWDGTQWSALGAGVTGSGSSVTGIAVSGNTVFVGGFFSRAGGLSSRNIARWTAGSWSPFSGTGLDGAPSAIAISGTDVYVGGTFNEAGPILANRIAKWDNVTSTWSSLSTGVSGAGTENSSISAIAVAGDKVYAGGSFPRIGGITAANIAVWNGTNWAPLGTGITGGNARVSAIVVQGEDVIVGGDFTTAGGVAANRIARWNGTSWSAFPGSPPIPSAVTGIGFVGGDMYVGSASTTVENPNYLLKFDGSTWTGLAPGMGGHGVTSVAVSGSDVYITGGFQTVAGVPAVRIAKWNGSFWSPVGGGLPTTTGSASVFVGASGNDIIAVGDFTVASGGPANYIAKWNGTNWAPMGNGLNAPASRVVAAGGDVFVSGGFTTAGCNISPYFARWRETVWTGTAGTDWHTAGNWGSGSVPPANSSVTIASGNAAITSADVTLSNLILTNGRSLTVGAGRTLTVTGRLDISNGTLVGPGTVVVNDLNIASGVITGVSSLTVSGDLYLGDGTITATPVMVTSCRPAAIAGGDAAGFVASALTRCVNSPGVYRFPVGTGSQYAPVELANAAGSGNFTIESRSGPYPGPITGLPDNRLQRWWDLSNGGITLADLTFTYSDGEVVGLESWYRVYRVSGASAIQLPTTINTTANRMTVNGVSQFSAWTLAEGTPAPATLSGRVTRPSGKAAWGVLVSLTDDQGNTNYTMTNPFGYYRFVNVPTFRMYTVRVTSKRYTFAAPERTVPFDEYTTAVNFVSSDH